jgi:hypothetical protein
MLRMRARRCGACAGGTFLTRCWGVSLRFAPGRAFALRVEPRCACLAPDGLQSLTSARRAGAARFACSWSTRPLRAGGQQV